MTCSQDVPDVHVLVLFLLLLLDGGGFSRCLVGSVVDHGVRHGQRRPVVVGLAPCSVPRPLLVVAVEPLAVAPR